MDINVKRITKWRKQRDKKYEWWQQQQKRNEKLKKIASIAQFGRQVDRTKEKRKRVMLSVCHTQQYISSVDVGGTFLDSLIKSFFFI